MRDDDWYKPKPRRHCRGNPSRGSLSGRSRRTGTYRCELLFHEQGGTEAQILKDGELMYGRRFEEGWQTLQWAEEERKHLEQGGD
jgi:hypothetical protein